MCANALHDCRASVRCRRARMNSGMAGWKACSTFPGCEVSLKPAVLAPPISRMVAPGSWVLGEALHALPFLRTHYAGLIRKGRRSTED
jgi:hypothetical protein